MLEINDLTVQYGSGQPVLKQFKLLMKPGEIVGIVGESGSGKTTVIRSVLGALPRGGRIVSGNICFQGRFLQDDPPKQRRQMRGNQMAMIFQDCGGALNPIRKIGKQYVEYIRTHSSLTKQEAWSKAVSMLNTMHLSASENVMDSYPHQLSGGMRQRVGIAMAMTFKPQLLLADEPTSALDVTTQAQIVDQMLKLRDQYRTGIIIVTHNLGVASYMADQLIVMHNGNVVDQGSREQVLYHPTSDYTKILLQSVPEMEGKRFVS